MLSESVISALKRMLKPLSDLHVQDPFRLNSLSLLAAMPDGEAISIYRERYFQYLRINKQGKTVPEQLYCELCSQDTPIRGLLILGVNLYVIHSNGQVLEFSLKNYQQLNVYYIQNVSHVKNAGSLYSDPDLIPDKDVLLLVDSGKNEVFTYNMTSHQKIVRIRGIRNPSSVTYSFYNNTPFYIVCVRKEHSINVYDKEWHLLKKIKSEYPYSAIIAPEQTIFVSSYNRVTEFSLQGQFLGHVISLSDNRYFRLISFSYPHLWLLKSVHGEPERYKLYDDKIV